jgi:uncharacterized cupredoxin-like copper-binding protein
MSSHSTTPVRLLMASAAAVTLGTTTIAAPTITARTRGVQDITIVASDFRFEAPDTVRAGLTRIRLRNRGPEFHHVQLVQLRDGGTITELLDTLGTALVKTPAGTRFVGGPNVPPISGSSEVTLTLRPGQYALICFVSGADHIAHMHKGMTRLLTVTPTRETSASRPRTPEPTADARMVLHDFAFDITPAIRAGRRTVRVENAASQPHEAVLGKLATGKTLADLMQWMATREGPMPGEQIGGTAALSQGEVNFLTVDFTPGEYILLCFVRDAGDGKSHVAHGMARQFTVEPVRAAAAPSPTTFAWPGVYDVVATGFPDGERAAVLQIARTDTSYSLVTLQGPPGSLERFQVSGDSARVRWNLGTEVMVVDLRGSGDSLTGMWMAGELAGFLKGARRR